VKSCVISTSGLSFLKFLKLYSTILRRRGQREIFRLEIFVRLSNGTSLSAGSILVRQGRRELTGEGPDLSIEPLSCQMLYAVPDEKHGAVTRKPPDIGAEIQISR
jgi:hypothetical protein